MERGFPDSSLREPFDVGDLALLLDGKKGEPTWSINSRQSTAEYFYEENPNANVNYWRDSAYSFASQLHFVDRLKDYRRSIQTASYWKVEAKHLEREFWKIQRLKHPQQKPESKEDGHPQHKPESREDGHPQQKPESKEDEPVSSRLRNRKTKVSASRKHEARKPVRKSKIGSNATKRIEKPQKRSTTDARIRGRRKPSFKNAKS
jgi:hypothetical protein